MNDSSLNNYQQLITSRQIDANKGQPSSDNYQEIEMIDQKNVGSEYVKQVKNYDEQSSTPEQYNTPTPDDQEKDETKKIEQESLTQSFYIAYMILLIPLCASITGLTDTEQIIFGSIPSKLRGLFIGILIVSIFNLIYLILTQIFVGRRYVHSIPTKPKFIIGGIWFLWNIGFLVLGGLSYEKYQFMIKDCEKYYTEIWASEAISLYTTAQNTLCTSSCSCDMKFPFILTSDLQLKIAPYINNSQMVVNISQCNGYGTKDDLFYQLKQVENNWKCSGICSPLNMYYFTDINRGIPEEKRPCLQVAVEDYLPQVINLSKFSSLFTAIVQTIVILYFLFGNYLKKLAESIRNKYSSEGGDSKKYSSGGSNGSGGQEIDFNDNDEKPHLEDYYEETMQGTETTPTKGPEYFAKMFNAKGKNNTKVLSRQSTKQSSDTGLSYQITSSKFMNVLRKSKLPNEETNNYDSPHNN